MKNNWLRFIGWFEIIGGIVGLIFAVIYTLLGLIALIISLQIFGILAGILTLALFALSFHAGRQLLKSAPDGFKLSKIVQALQIPMFSFFGIPYRFLVGVNLPVQFTLAKDSMTIETNLFPGLGIIFEGYNFDLNFVFHLVNINYSYAIKGLNFILLAEGGEVMFGINIAAIIMFVYLLRQKPDSSSPKAPI